MNFITNTQKTKGDNYLNQNIFSQTNFKNAKKLKLYIHTD